MKFCPVCGVELKPRVVYGIEIDQCPKCGGVWLDGGELNKLIAAVKELGDYSEYEDVEVRREKKKRFFEFFDELFD
ncbi:zf-TFIIB domain-containing protein [Pyrobaculum neutrophilum]|uniref:Transcription factor zinc-finger domain-containing protein n=1 Tax=Pyrobaculum neutrophilum (strain DSM 2338 / JCM 9278 / NBRC 100436 / V24Sta) TaxID=444157 RepID=B1YCF2_PYRNV|nr:zf-TFIIB domain-containing protein [Pyrobaculum neutrophilum]ACB39465.1 conserved hypothetical protein [Pyrobaculum neutrophilum V24Sta]